MPKVRVSARASGSSPLPPELADAHSALWESIPRVKAWLVRHGVEGFDVASHGPLNRHGLAVRGWADAHDWVRVTGAGHRNPDWARLRAADVPRASGAVILERLRRVDP